MSILGKSTNGKTQLGVFFVRVDINNILSKIEAHIIFTFIIKATDINTIRKIKTKINLVTFLQVVFLSVFRLSFMHS